MKIRDNIANEFDEFSKDYTNDMVKCVPYYNELILNFITCLPPAFKPTTILDLGCGNGNVTDCILKKFPDSQYTLLDASQEMLTLCQQRFKNHDMDYVAFYFNDFEFKHGHYDFIVAGFSLHHCSSEDKKDLFRKIYLSLKPFGIFSFSDLMINKNNPKHPELIRQWKTFVSKNYENNEKWEWLMEHYNEFDKPDNHIDQLAWLRKAGFKHFNSISKEKYWIHCQSFKA